MNLTRLEQAWVDSQSELAEKVSRWNMGKGNEDFDKNHFKEKIRNVLPCETTFEALNSQTAIDIFHMSLNLHGANLETEKSWYWISRYFLWKLQERVLPEEKYIEFYYSLKNSDKFRKKLHRITRSINYKMSGDMQRAVLDRQDYILNVDKIFQAIDDMITIAKIESWKQEYETIWWRVDHIYYQHIWIEWEIPKYLRDLQTWEFYKDFWMNPDPDHFDLKAWKKEPKIIDGKFLLFENAVVSASDFSFITHVESKQETLHTFENGMFQVDNSIFTEIDWSYKKIWTVEWEFGSGWHVVDSGHKVFIQWEALLDLWNTGCRFEFVENIRAIGVNAFQTIDAIWVSRMINRETAEVIWSSQTWDILDDSYDWIYKDKIDSFKASRHWKDILVDIKTWEETEIIIWPHYFDKIKSIFWKKVLRMYNNTIDYVDNFLLPITDRGANGWVVPSLDEIQFWDDTEKSDEFKKKYLRPEQIKKTCIILAKDKHIKSHFDGNISEVMEVGLKQYFYNEPNCYEVSGYHHNITSKVEQLSEFRRTKIGEYNIITNIKTGEMRLVKNLDWEINEREFIDLPKWYPIDKYLQDKNLDRVKADIKLYWKLKDKSIDNIVKFFWDWVEWYFAFGDKKYYYLEWEELITVDFIEWYIDSDSDIEYYFRLNEKVYTIIWTAIFVT